MKASYTVKTKNGKVYKWGFTEFKGEGNYGNGTYIGIKYPSGDSSMIDCRYILGYTFHDTCVNYLRAYYGGNLDELTKDDF